MRGRRRRPGRRAPPGNHQRARDRDRRAADQGDAQRSPARPRGGGFARRSRHVPVRRPLLGPVSRLRQPDRRGGRGAQAAGALAGVSTTAVHLPATLRAMPKNAQVRRYRQRLRALRALPRTGRGRPAHEAEIVRTTCRTAAGHLRLNNGSQASLACPTCGREPVTRHEALQQREDLAIVWLHLDGDRVTEARHCVACQPHGPSSTSAATAAATAPDHGQPPELGDQLAAPALDWMHSRGWQLHPQPPADHR